MPKTWIVDLDGTVALMDGRGPYDWYLVATDLPNIPVIAVINALVAAGDDIVFVSGRSDRCRYNTEIWLLFEVGLWTADAPLHMRRHGDGRPDAEVKREIYDRYLSKLGNIAGAFDDTDTVIALWRSLGIFVFQVGDRKAVTQTT
jgi:hypothetical protein